MAFDLRRFDWHTLPAEQQQQMLDLVRSLGLDPDVIATDFALTRRDNQPWQLHLTEFERGDGGMVADVAAQCVASRPVVREIAPPVFLLGTEADRG